MTLLNILSTEWFSTYVPSNSTASLSRSDGKEGQYRELQSEALAERSEQFSSVLYQFDSSGVGTQERFRALTELGMGKPLLSPLSTYVLGETSYVLGESKVQPCLVELYVLGANRVHAVVVDVVWVVDPLLLVPVRSTAVGMTSAARRSTHEPLAREMLVLLFGGNSKLGTSTRELFRVAR